MFHLLTEVKIRDRIVKLKLSFSLRVKNGLCEMFHGKCKAFFSINKVEDGKLAEQEDLEAQERARIEEFFLDPVVKLSFLLCSLNGVISCIKKMHDI